jgi:hypothetical protein
VRPRVAILLVLGLPLLAAACGGEGSNEEGPAGDDSPPAAEASEAALREAATAYERALVRLDLVTTYALEPAEFREACPFEAYEALVAPLLPEWLDECDFQDTSNLDFVIEEVTMEGEVAWVGGYWKDQSGNRCGGYGQWGYRGAWSQADQAWVPLDTLPCVYAHENERLLDALPEASGAEELTSDRYIYTRGEGPPFRHAIRVTYKAPPRMSDQDVIDFYVESLGSEWAYTVPDIGGAPWLAALFTKGMAEVSIDTANMDATEPQFDVHVDARGAEPQ